MSKKYSIGKVKISIKVSLEDCSDLSERCSCIFSTCLQDLLFTELSLMEMTVGDMYIDEPILINLGELSALNFEQSFFEKFSAILKSEMKLVMLSCYTNWEEKLYILSNDDMSYDLLWSELTSWPPQWKPFIAEYFLSPQSNWLCEQLRHNFILALCHWLLPDFHPIDGVTQNTIYLSALCFLQQYPHNHSSMIPFSNYDTKPTVSNTLLSYDLSLLRRLFKDHPPSNSWCAAVVIWLCNLWQTPQMRQYVIPAMQLSHFNQWEQWVHESLSRFPYMSNTNSWSKVGEGAHFDELFMELSYEPLHASVKHCTYRQDEGCTYESLPEKLTTPSYLASSALTQVPEEGETDERPPEMLRSTSYLASHEFTQLRKEEYLDKGLSQSYSSPSDIVLHSSAHDFRSMPKEGNESLLKTHKEPFHMSTNSLVTEFMRQDVNYLNHELIKQESNRPSRNPSYEINLKPVNFAGLALLWPFLPGLFQQLGLIERGCFLNLQAQHNAAASLDWLLLEGRSSSGPTISHWLCGLIHTEQTELSQLNMDIHQKLMRWLDMLPSLLHGTWRKLSVSDICQWFLLRPGWISINNKHNTLFIQPDVFDVLLNDWQWPIDIIILPWLDQPLTVRWMQPQ